MTMPSERRFAGVLAHHNGSVVLVREEHSRWGGVFWNLPSGMLEAREAPAEGAARELAEETGLRVAPSDLCLRTTSSTVVDGMAVHAWNFEVEVVEAAITVGDPEPPAWLRRPHMPRIGKRNCRQAVVAQRPGMR